MKFVRLHVDARIEYRPVSGIKRIIDVGNGIVEVWFMNRQPDQHSLDPDYGCYDKFHFGKNELMENTFEFEDIFNS